MENKGPVYVLACYFMYGLYPIFWKLLAEVDSFYVLAVRIVFSMLVTAVILTALRGFGTVRAVFSDRQELRRLALASAFMCVNWGLYIWAVNSGRGVDASLAYYMEPVLAILLGSVAFREKLTKLQWLSVAVTLAGLVVTVVRNGQMPWTALLIGGTFAVYSALKKKIHVTGSVSMFFETLFLSPLALIFMGWAEMHGSGAAGILSGAEWLLLPAAGIVTAVPLMVFAQGMKTTPLSLSGVLMYINPTMQLLISVWLFHEEFTATHAILFGFVWGGVAIYLLASLLEMRGKEHTSCE